MLIAVMARCDTYNVVPLLLIQDRDGLFAVAATAHGYGISM